MIIIDAFLEKRSNGLIPSCPSVHNIADTNYLSSYMHLVLADSPNTEPNGYNVQGCASARPGSHTVNTWPCV